MHNKQYPIHVSIWKKIKGSALIVLLLSQSTLGAPPLSEPTFDHIAQANDRKVDGGRGEGPDFNELSAACGAPYESDGKRGSLGKKVENIRPNGIYERFDSILGKFVFIQADAKGNIDQRPLVAGAVVSCAALDKFNRPSGAAESDLSGQCILSENPDENWIALTNSDRRSEKLISAKIHPKFQIGRTGLATIDYQFTTETSLLPIAAARQVLGNEPARPRELGSVEGLIPPPRSGGLSQQSPQVQANSQKSAGSLNIPSNFTKRVSFEGNDYMVPEGHHVELWKAAGGDGVVRIVPDGMELVRTFRNGRAQFEALPRNFTPNRGNFIPRR